MSRTAVVALALVALLGSTIDAQQPTAEPPAWQAVAATLPPGTSVAIRLKDGRRFSGTILQQGPDALLFKPRTRVPVPAAEIAFRDIDSLEPRKPGMSPGLKVVIGVGIGVGTVMLLAAIALASAY